MSLPPPPSSIAVRVIATCTAFTVLAVFCVVLRLIVRIGLVRNAGHDEWTIIASVICSIGLLVADFGEVAHGLGRHFYEISLEEWEEVVKCLWISILFYNASLSLTKASIIVQYTRVFSSARVRSACYFTLVLIVIIAIQTMLTAIFNCIPISAFWRPDEDAICISKEFLWFFNAGFNILTEVILLALPIGALKSLGLPFRQRMGVYGIFAVGGFALIISVLRLRSLYILSITKDPTWDNTDAAMWSNLEVNTGIICASLPTIRPLITRLISPSPHQLNEQPPKKLSHSTSLGQETELNIVRPKFGIKGTHTRLADLETGFGNGGGGGNSTTTIVEAKRGGSRDGIGNGGDIGEGIFVKLEVVQSFETRKVNETGAGGYSMGRKEEWA